MKKKKKNEIKDYDEMETTSWIDPTKKLSLADMGFKLPSPPTQVVSIRLPTPLLNQLRATASTRDIPYQALIKIILSHSLKQRMAI